MVGSAGRYVFISLEEHGIYCLMSINQYCMQCSVIENDENVAG